MARCNSNHSLETSLETLEGRREEEPESEGAGTDHLDEKRARGQNAALRESSKIPLSRHQPEVDKILLRDGSPRTYETKPSGISQSQ